jgi:hypothetical protein
MTETIPSRKKIVTVISAHEGATTWANLCRFITATSCYEVRSFHQYDDVRYRSARSSWSRVALRFSTFIWFPLRFILSARRLCRQSDLLLVVTSPFFMPMLAALFAKYRGTRLVVLMNDIYPEALVAKKLLKRGGAPERVLKKWLSSALRRVDAVVFICESHFRFVARDISLPPLTPTIPVSGHSDPFENLNRQESAGAAEVVYCGTLGLMHDTTTFLRWLERCRGIQQVAFSFFTSGAAKQRFESEVKALVEQGVANSNIQIGDSLSDDEWIGVMSRAQVGLVFQDAGSGVVIFPSKVASILTAGQAVLAVGLWRRAICRLSMQPSVGFLMH